AKPGYRVVVSDGPIEEDATILASNLGLPKDVTLETEAGATVEWRLRRSIAQAPSTLLTLSHVEGLTLRGFTFDGGNRIRDLLTVTGICPGLTIEDIKLKNFMRTGIAFGNCQGTAERPVTIRQIRLALDKPAETGFLFDINTQIKDISVNQHIKISDVSLNALTTFTTSKLWQLARPEVIDKTVILPK